MTSAFHLTWDGRLHSGLPSPKELFAETRERARIGKQPGASKRETLTPLRQRGAVGRAQQETTGRGVGGECPELSLLLGFDLTLGMSLAKPSR